MDEETLQGRKGEDLECRREEAGVPEEFSVLGTRGKIGEPEQRCVGGLLALDRGCTSHPRQGDIEWRGCLGFASKETV